MDDDPDVRDSLRRALGTLKAPAAVERILIPAMADAEDVDLLIPFIVAPQLLAFEAAVCRGLSPDRPNVSGTVNRVVQGVRIHAFDL